jgi:hypothetical protein
LFLLLLPMFLPLHLRLTDHRRCRCRYHTSIITCLGSQASALANSDTRSRPTAQGCGRWSYPTPSSRCGRPPAGPRRRRRRPLGALCWRRAPAPVACTAIRHPGGRTAGRRVVVLVCGSTTLPVSLSAAAAAASSVSHVAPTGTARSRCSSSCSYTPIAHHRCSAATYAVVSECLGKGVAVPIANWQMAIGNCP